MMSICKLKSAAQAEHYYERDDYYVRGRGPSGWWGRLSREFGLSGEVERGRFASLLRGELPDGGRLPGGHGGDRSPGTDVTFSAPKSVSVMALVAGDERVTRAHRRAVDRALGWLEKNACLTRTTSEGVTVTEPGEGLLVARFDHDLSRGLDPQLHTHCVVLNVTRRPDGKLRAIQNHGFFERQKLAGAIYRSELADRLLRLGYRVERRPDGTFELGGFSREQVESFSTRRRQILEALRARGYDSARAAEVACLDTRESKQEVDRRVLRELWRQRARQAGIGLEVPRTRERSRQKSRPRAAAELVEMAVAHLEERRSVFSREQVLVHCLERGAGRVLLEHLEREIARRVEDGRICELAGGGYTTDRALQLERNVVRFCERGRDSLVPMVPGKALEEWLGARAGGPDGLRFTDGQRRAIELVCTTRDAVCGVQGYAGTGKTTMLRAVRELAESRGYSVRGLCPTAAAAEQLERATGVDTDTLAGFLAEGRGGSADGWEGERGQRLWIVDEASMMGTAQAERLLRRARRRGARVLLVGDRGQLPAVEAGSPFRLLYDRGMQVAVMKEVLRQRNTDLKQAVVDTIEGRDRRAVRRLAGDIAEIPERERRLERVVKAYLDGRDRAGEPPLLVTGTNRDRRDLNDLVRRSLVERGELGAESCAADVYVNRSFTRAEIADLESYRPGDVVRFGRAYRLLGVERGEYLTVERVDREREDIALVSEGGKRVRWQPFRHGKVEVYGREERELRAGDVIRWTRNDRALGRRNGNLARVVEVSAETGRAVVEFSSSGKVLRQELALDGPGHWEHGYASTVHAAQGRTTGEVVVHIDTTARAVVGHESWYVAISRARDRVRVFTDDATRLPEAVTRSLGQENALDGYKLAVGGARPGGAERREPGHDPDTEVCGLEERERERRPGRAVRPAHERVERVRAGFFGRWLG